MSFLDDFLNFLGNTSFERILSVVLLAAIGYLAYRWVIEPIYTALVGMWDFWRSRNMPAKYLEITPPAHPEKSPLATRQLFAVLQQLIGKGEVMPLEFDSSHEEGIRYLIRTHPADIPALQRHVASYLPEARFRILDAPPLGGQTEGAYTRVLEIKQRQHYAYPLQPQEKLDLSDPVSYIVGSMAQNCSRARKSSCRW